MESRVESALSHTSVLDVSNHQGILRVGGLYFKSYDVHSSIFMIEIPFMYCLK